MLDAGTMNEGSAVAGIIAHDQLVQALRAQDEQASVATVMNRAFDTASSDEPLDAVLARRDPERAGVVPV